MQLAGKAVLLSIKPKYADLIISGSKTVELRRSWPSNDIGTMVVYSSSPVQKLTGIVIVAGIKECTFEQLWTVAQEHGGGVTYDELRDYIGTKSHAYGVMLGKVFPAEVQIDPKEIFENFTPPQGFLYLGPNEFQRVLTTMFPSGVPL